MSKIIAREFIHACHVPRLEDGTDCVVVKCRTHAEDGTIGSELKVIEKPIRTFYTTKPAAQNHEFKKEREALKSLDKHVVPNYRLVEELDKVLNGQSFGNNTYRRKSLVQLCSSQYVYGADLHIESLIKKKYFDDFEKSGLRPTKTTSGMFDAETDMIGGDGTDPNIITVTHENKVYTAILEKFFLVKQSDGTYRRGDIEEFKELSKKTLDHHISELLANHVKENPKSVLAKKVAETPFEYFYYVGKTTISLIRWIFAQIHQNKTDFIGIWNLDFDIPTVLASIKNSGVTYEEIFCPPDLPKKYHYVRYDKDEKEAADIYRRWHWLNNTSYTQFIDSMCLYRILRTVKGGESGGMSLDNVLKNNDLGGKLTFKDDDPATEDLSGADWHRYMQKNEPYKYIMYNQFDCISMQLMEWKNDDLGSMATLGGISRLCKWTKQTRKVADSLYFDSLEDGMITASPGPEEVMYTVFDKLTPKVGGAVLRPERTTEIGLRIFSDRPDIITYLHSFTSDVDFSGMYPACNIVCNISKETKISTGIKIDGFTQTATQTFYSLAIALKENVNMMASTYFGLKNYDAMSEAFDEYLKNKQI